MFGFQKEGFQPLDFWCFGFFVGIWSWLADKLDFILVMKLHFKSQPSSNSTLFLQDYCINNNARLNSNQFLLQVFDPNERCLKNGFFSGGLKPGPLSHESSALTIRPRLIRFCWFFMYLVLMHEFYEVSDFDALVFNFETSVFDALFFY